jgi:colanic acid/amylovoran biosynthesis glycosyltransferase
MKTPVVGYMVRMFPQHSETFIANEILELERLGAQIRVYSYRRPRAAVPHESVRLIQAPVTYLPDPLYRHPGMLFHANKELRRLEPERYHRTIRYVLTWSFRERNLDTWRRFLQAVYLAYLLKSSDVQHLHAHFAHGATRVAMLASMLTGIPYSFTAHARDLFSNDVNYRLLREKVEQAQFVVTVSQYNRRFLGSKIGPLASASIRTLYNGVDLHKFSPDPRAGREDTFILGVGRLVEKKGFSYLIKACRLLQDQGHQFRCEIVGDGELRQRLEREVHQMGIKGVVRFVGLRSQEELPAYYHRAALLVMPAVLSRDGNRDALPTVLLEGMACGLPVVASRLTGIPEIIDHGENGLLVEPKDPVGLAEAIAILLNNPKLRDRFGIAARTKAERCFDLRKSVRELYQLFRQSVEIQQFAEQ